MRWFSNTGLSLLLLILGGCGPTPFFIGDYRPFFSPQHNLEKIISDAIENAQSEIKVQATTIESGAIANALMDAAHRNISVVILASNQFSDTNKYFLGSKVKVWIDQKHRIDGEYIVIDQRVLIVGGYKYGQQKHSNYILVHNLPALAIEFLRNWGIHASHTW